MLTFLHGYQFVILIVLLFCMSFFLLILLFVLQWLSLHWEILIMVLSLFIDFPSNSKHVAPFYCINLWLFSCWLAPCSWSIERCSMGGYTVCKGVSVPFLRHQPLDQPAPLSKIFVSPLLCSVTLPLKVFYSVPPNLTEISRALIWPTNLLWLKEISRGLICNFNFPFLAILIF